jgi:hypothetical protein
MSLVEHIGYALLAGGVRIHQSPASTCRLKAIQNAAAKLSGKLSSADARSMPNPSESPVQGVVLGTNALRQLQRGA